MACHLCGMRLVPVQDTSTSTTIQRQASMTRHNELLFGFSCLGWSERKRIYSAVTD